MKKNLLILIFIGLSVISEAQFSRYIIRLTDKGSNPFTLSNPAAFLSDRSISRRQRYNIPLDSTDLPVTPRYIDSIRLAGAVTILNTSKWLNQVAIQTTDAAALTKINSFPFVISTDPIAARNQATIINKFEDQSFVQQSDTQQETADINNYYNYGKSYGQVRIHQGQFLHNHGFRGQGMFMAVLDAGFFHYLTLPAFDSIRNNNQILGTWDFVANEQSVNEDFNHGMECLSTIAANIPGRFIGQAPQCSFYLFRTEDIASEYPIEEQNWAAGMERSDSLGIDITSTSLGYSEFDNAVFNYTHSQLDGNTTIAARIADLAAKKGIIVIAAAGNEGTGTWHYIITPADADSVVAVGAVDTLGNVPNFSSYGPSGDGQIKPDLAAVGWNAVVASPSTGLPVYNNGTSFACPNLAGITTCLWQAFPEINNMGIIAAMKSSASRTSNPNDRMGYGIPDMKKSFVILIKQLAHQSVSTTQCLNKIHLTVKSDSTMNLLLESRANGEPDYGFFDTKTVQGDFMQRDLEFNDDVSNRPAGPIEYRIRMDIGTDTSFYFDILSVNNTGNCEPLENALTIKPNPVADKLIISLSRTASTPYDILLHNSLGQRVFSTSGVQPPGTGIINIPMYGLNRGVYYITILLDSKKALTKKIFKN